MNKAIIKLENRLRPPGLMNLNGQVRKGVIQSQWFISNITVSAIRWTLLSANHKSKWLRHPAYESSTLVLHIQNNFHHCFLS